MNCFGKNLATRAADFRKYLSSLLTKLASFSPAASFSALLTFACLAIAVAIYLFAPSIRKGFGQGLFVEFGGAIFDLLIFGILVALFLEMRDRRQLLQRYQDEIDDFKNWESEEARRRIAGNLRRLVRMGKTDIDLRGIWLHNFSFEREGITTLRNSAFHSVMVGQSVGLATGLDNVDFGHVDCRGVVFSKQDPPYFLVASDLRFEGANLEGARFDGAALSWKNVIENKDDWCQCIDGVHVYDSDPYYTPAFLDANLKGCSFRRANLERADFRMARNVDQADFLGAHGLDTCLFDDDVRDRVLAQSKNTASSD